MSDYVLGCKVNACPSVDDVREQDDAFKGCLGHAFLQQGGFIAGDGQVLDAETVVVESGFADGVLACRIEEDVFNGYSASAKTFNEGCRDQLDVVRGLCLFEGDYRGSCYDHRCRWLGYGFHVCYFACGRQGEDA